MRGVPETSGGGAPCGERGAWHHVAVTLAHGCCKQIYVDGARAAETVTASPFVANRGGTYPPPPRAPRRILRVVWRGEAIHHHS